MTTEESIRATLRLLSVCCIAILSLLGEARATEISWTNTTGGSWSIPANWNPSQVPGVTDTVLITAPGTYSVRLDTSNTVARLEIGGNSGTQILVDSAQTLTITGAAAVNQHGVLSVPGGVVNGAGAISVTGAISWSGGTFGGTGSLDVLTGATMSIAGADFKTLDTRTINNAGAITWTDPGQLLLINGATINNQAGGLFDLQNDVSLTYNGGALTPFVNSGTLRKSAGTGISVINGGVLFNNTLGTVDVQTGTISMIGGGTSTGGTFNAGDQGTLDLVGGQFVFEGSYSGTGNGPFNLSSATLQIGANGATFNFPNGGFNWRGGTITGGVLTNNGAFNITGNDFAHVLSAGTITNNGTVTWTGRGPIDASSGAVFNNQAGASFVIRTDLNYQSSGNNCIFNNAGLLQKRQTTGITAYSGTTVTNTGTMDIQTGTLSFNPGSLTNSSTGIIQGTGTLIPPVGAFADNGNINPGSSPGQLSISGSISPSVTANFNMEIGGTQPGTQYDVLAISGTANLNGSLNLSLINGFIPLLGEQFRVMTWASHSGQLAAVHGQAINDSLMFVPDYRADGLYVVVQHTVPLAAPQGLTISPQGGDAVLNWQPVPGAASYSVYRSLDPTVPIFTELVGNTTATTLTDLGVIAGNLKYFYQVRAVVN